MGTIRLLLALSVVITHSAQGRLFGFELVGGQAAVQAFYVISGFYMALVLHRKYTPDLDGYRTFLLARLFRLFPAYFFVLLLAIALALSAIVPHPALARWKQVAPLLSPAGHVLFGGTQLSLLGQDATLFTSVETQNGQIHFAPRLEPVPPGQIKGNDLMFVGQAWTLSVELMFYLVAPLIVRHVWRIVPLFLLSWGIRLTLATLGYREDPWLYRFFPSELAMFLLGAMAYHVYARLEPHHARMARLGWPALAWMVLVIVMLFRFDLPLRSLMVSGSMGVCVPFIFALMREVKWDRWVGELSYPVYICHELVRLAMLHWMPAHTGAASFVAMTLLASVAIMVCVEQPAGRLRGRFIARRTTAAGE